MSEIGLTREHIREKVFQAIGQASMCSLPIPSTEVFDTEQASEIATDICRFVMAEKRKYRET